jgi:general secretion pathway protein E
VRLPRYSKVVDPAKSAFTKTIKSLFSASLLMTFDVPNGSLFMHVLHVRRVCKEGWSVMANGVPEALPATSDPRSEKFVSELSKFLVDAGQIDPFGLKRAQRAQAETDERFDLVLLRLGLLDERALAETLSRFLRLPFIDPNKMPDAPVIADRAIISFLASKIILPIDDDGRLLTAAMADPLDSEAVASLGFLLDRRIEVAVGVRSALQSAIKRFYSSPVRVATEAFGSEQSLAQDDDVRRLRDMASDAPVIQFVHDLISRAAGQNASDIHLEPHHDSLHIRLRTDGELKLDETLSPAMATAVISRIKIISRLDISERRLPQDGRVRVNVEGREIDLRVSTMPNLDGEGVVMRLLDKAAVPLDFAALGLSHGLRNPFFKLLEQPNGIVLVTGPTGSGKTTTLYTALSLLDRPHKKVFTVEDPVEYRLEGLNQIQVQPKIGLTFAHTLRSVLRQDPDIIMVGEIRDLETARVAVQASLTGHLVLSTLHTSSAASTVARLLDMGVERYLLVSSLRGVVAQRLVRKLCNDCAKPSEPTMVLKHLVESRGGKLDEAQALRLRERSLHGCAKCRQTGFNGRTMIAELLEIRGNVRSVMLSGGSELDLEAAATSDGAKSMIDDGLEKVLDGTTTLDEVLRVTRLI